MLLQNLHVVDELVLFLSHSLVMHPMEIALFAKFVPSGRCLYQQPTAELLDQQASAQCARQQAVAPAMLACGGDPSITGGCRYTSCCNDVLQTGLYVCRTWQNWTRKSQNWHPCHHASQAHFVPSEQRVIQFAREEAWWLWAACSCQQMQQQSVHLWDVSHVGKTAFGLKEMNDCTSLPSTKKALM